VLLLWILVSLLIVVMAAFVREKMKVVDKVPPRLEQIELKVDDVHKLVNSRLSSVLDRVDQLTAALTDAGEEVPDDPASPPIR